MSIKRKSNPAKNTHPDICAGDAYIEKKRQKCEEITSRRRVLDCRDVEVALLIEAATTAFEIENVKMSVSALLTF